MLKDFKQFVMRGNVLDLAIAVILGAAFGQIVTSLVNDIIMPPIGLVLGRVSFKKPLPQVVPTTKKCTYCISDIPIEATRCPNCTSHLA